jgi:hypothetical protein
MGPTRKPTKYEADRIDAMLRLGCVACAFIDLPVPFAEVHHILDGGRRMGHWFTIPLCPGHHRDVWSPEQLEVIEAMDRVSISDSRNTFMEVYPSERAMWNRVQSRLRLSRVWPVSKILPRRTA